MKHDHDREMNRGEVDLAFGGVLTEICPRRQDIAFAMDLSFRGWRYEFR
jgi:hypothetical protein